MAYIDLSTHTHRHISAIVSVITTRRFTSENSSFHVFYFTLFSLFFLNAIYDKKIYTLFTVFLTLCVYVD